MLDTDIAWAAGFYEGEGHITVGKGHRLRIGATQNDLVSLERLRTLFGGTIYHRKSSGSDWYAHGQRAIDIAAILRPWLSPRRIAQIDIAIEKWSNRVLLGSANARKTVCKRGHSLTLTWLKRLSGSHVNVEPVFGFAALLALLTEKRPYRV